MIVTATNPPSRGIWAANKLLNVPHYSAPYGSDVLLHLYGRRLDLVCMSVASGIPEFRVERGIAAAYPEAPGCPDGWIALAEITVYASQPLIKQADIRELHP